MVKNSRIFKAIIAAVLAAAIAIPTTFALHTNVAYAASSSDIQNNIDELEAEQDALKEQQESVAQELKQLKADKKKQLEYKQALDEQMVSIQKEVIVINKKIKTLDKQIKAKQAEIEDDEKQITETFDKLKQRIRALYLAGEASNLEILFNAENIADFADKVEVMKSITNNDTALIDTLKEELNQVKDQKAEIEQKRQEVSDARSELEAKQKEVQGLVEESNAVIAEINASEKEANSLANLAQAYKDYNAALSKEEQKKRQEAANKVVDVDDDNYNNDYNVPDNDNSGDGSGSQGSGTANGQFIWPAPGTTVITSGVGPRWVTNHNGIDISSGNAYGSPIVAADGGTVIVAVHSGWGGGYGLHVMIDHGNGYTTVYGHASSVLVNEGDKVSQGQTIAYIGSTGDSTGPHLHFEIRQNGSICDPEQYVSP